MPPPPPPPPSTLDVRIIAIFAIAAAALLCGLPPIFMRAFQSPDAPVARVSRAFAGGIILALALVRLRAWWDAFSCVSHMYSTHFAALQAAAAGPPKSQPSS
jgi:hypothetical protein